MATSTFPPAPAGARSGVFFPAVPMKQPASNVRSNGDPPRSGWQRLPTAELLEPRLCPTSLFVPSSAPPLPLNYFPGGGVVADFNSDRVPDVATIDENDDTLRVLLGSNAGVTAAPGNPINLGASGPLAVGDFNGDGKADVAFAYSSGSLDDGSVIAYLGNGDGTFALRPAPPPRMGPSRSPWRRGTSRATVAPIWSFRTGRAESSRSC